MTDEIKIIKAPRRFGAALAWKHKVYNHLVPDALSGDMLEQDRKYWRSREKGTAKPPPALGGMLDAINQDRFDVATKTERVYGKKIYERKARNRCAVTSLAEAFDRIVGDARSDSDSRILEFFRYAKQVPGLESLQLPDDIQAKFLEAEAYQQESEELAEHDWSQGTEELPDIASADIEIAISRARERQPIPFTYQPLPGRLPGRFSSVGPLENLPTPLRTPDEEREYLAQKREYLRLSRQKKTCQAGKANGSRAHAGETTPSATLHSVRSKEASHATTTGNAGLGQPPAGSPILPAGERSSGGSKKPPSPPVPPAGGNGKGPKKPRKNVSKKKSRKKVLQNKPSRKTTRGTRKENAKIHKSAKTTTVVSRRYRSSGKVSPAYKISIAKRAGSKKTPRPAKTPSAAARKGWRSRRENIAKALERKKELARERARKKHELPKALRKQILDNRLQKRKHIVEGTVRTRDFKIARGVGESVHFYRERSLFFKEPKPVEIAFKEFEPWSKYQIALFEAILERKVGARPVVLVNYKTWFVFDGDQVRVNFEGKQVEASDINYRDMAYNIESFAKKDPSPKLKQLEEEEDEDEEDETEEDEEEKAAKEEARLSELGRTGRPSDLAKVLGYSLIMSTTDTNKEGATLARRADLDAGPGDKIHWTRENVNFWAQVNKYNKEHPVK